MTPKRGRHLPDRRPAGGRPQPGRSRTDKAVPSAADGFYLAGYVPLAVGLLLLIRARTPGRDRASLIDAAIIAIAYPGADVLLLALVVRLLVGAGVHNTAFRLLASSLLVMLAGDIGFAVLAQAGGGAYGRPDPPGGAPGRPARAAGRARPAHRGRQPAGLGPSPAGGDGPGPPRRDPAGRGPAGSLPLQRVQRPSSPHAPIRSSTRPNRPDATRCWRPGHTGHQPVHQDPAHMARLADALRPGS